MNEIPTIKFEFYGEEVELIPSFGRYGNGRLAITFEDYNTGEPFGTATINMPDAHLNDGEFFIKTWSENEQLAEALIKQGWIKSTGRDVVSGYVTVTAFKAHGKLALFAKFVGVL